MVSLMGDGELIVRQSVVRGRYKDLRPGIVLLILLWLDRHVETCKCPVVYLSKMGSFQSIYVQRISLAESLSRALYSTPDDPLLERSVTGEYLGP
jgi:hypothetical protein